MKAQRRKPIVIQKDQGSGNMIQANLWMPAKLKIRLQGLAAELGVTQSYMVRECLREGCDAWEQRMEDCVAVRDDRGELEWVSKEEFGGKKDERGWYFEGPDGTWIDEASYIDRNQAEAARKAEEEAEEADALEKHVESLEER